MDNNTKLPYYKVFVRDELSDYRIKDLSLEEFGAYQKLKFFLWIEEKIPLDFKILGKILDISAKKIEKLWKNLNLLFIVEGETEQFIRHSELDEQRHNYNVFIEKSRLGGIKSAELRSKVASTNLPTSVEANKTNTKQIENKTNGTHTQHNTKAMLAEQATAKTDGVRVDASQKSKFSYEERLEYAIACQESGQKINNPQGLAIKREDGKADEAIQNFFDSGKKLPKARDAAQIAIDQLRKKRAQRENE